MRTKYLIWPVIFSLVFYGGTLSAQSITKHGKLKVSRNGHFLTYNDGTPFFWLGDTAWELFHRLNKKEILLYLDNRHKNGFNVIQAVALTETGGLDSRNAYGATPLTAQDPTKPNEQWFSLIDWTLKQALKRDMFVALLPTWGDKVLKLWGEGPEIFDVDNAYKYGLYLGRRYKHYPNVIWVAGGDRPAQNDTIDVRPVWQALIKGIRTGAGNNALVTYHPAGESSSTAYWPNNDVLNINMLQSGHRKPDLPVWQWLERDFNTVPAKPVVDGEPCYEGHPINWDPRNGYFNEAEVRRQLYRSVFAGACGVTYGHNAVWQMYMPGKKAYAYPLQTWQQALNAPVALQVKHLKELIMSKPSLERVAMPELVQSQPEDDKRHIVAFSDLKKTYAMLYIPMGDSLTVQTSNIPASILTVRWFNPRTGKTIVMEKVQNAKQHRFKTPGKGDWVLVLEDASRYNSATTK